MTLFDSQESTDLFEVLSKRNPDSKNGFAIDNLVWEHFSLNEGQLDSNRKNDKMIPTIDQLSGGIEGFSVLELGPYEGYYSVAMEERGIAENLSIEANTLAPPSLPVMVDAINLVLE